MKIPPLDSWWTRRAARRLHDQETFAALNTQLPEDAVQGFVQSARDLDLRRSAFAPVDAYLHWSDLANHDFGDRRLQERRASFDRTLLRLRLFLNANVFRSRSGVSGETFQFWPDEDPHSPAIDHDAEVYLHSKVAELELMAENCLAEYARFRQAVRRKLLL
ncbi:MAG TPA: hypothetical protein VEV39_14790 [Gemmatimonadales bacterium]|nr:hypothetical protein [Gemmatimonadales bacterium]